MCKYVVGTENHVKTIRLMNTICDNLSSDDIKVIITSGSFGEGLQMIGSDLDLMFVLKDIEVHDSRTPIVFSRSKTNFSMMTEGTKPGFVMLQLIGSPHPLFCKKCRMDNYLSNVLFKQTFLNELGPFVHGPCISDIHGLFDMAPSLHSKSWFKAASGWIVRSNSAWPNENTKQLIIDHGVLFVPIGAKGSPHEEFEWRISFSVAEKLLIYTFSHTQLLCYALMKILLKDVINTDSRCTNLLCSYYLKTIIFWISEEIQPSAWTPANLIPCFMRCFRRLIYCVQYQVCPHYFIPENNMFENKIEGLARTNLIHTLHVFNKRRIGIPVSVYVSKYSRSRNHVDTNRLMHTVRDYLASVGTTVNITDGSFGEGLDMRGSDIDNMFVFSTDGDVFSFQIKYPMLSVFQPTFKIIKVS
ncbi:uncharacterized protein LOC134697916 [Mytilus trossulus]|uniref:uncharacterized protein LOC134697916 n=1 Tax=Mytilus trossulus TaxID=6551 RepID=UPI003005F24B